MIKELKIQSPSSATNRKKYRQKNDSTKTGSVDFTSTKWSTTDKQFENSPITVESTFYNTLRCKNYEKDDVVLENLKYFVNNSDSVKKIDKVDYTPKVVFTSKDYLKDNNSILNSIYHDNKFKNSQMKKNGKTASQISFYNFDSELCLDDNGNLFFYF